MDDTVLTSLADEPADNVVSTLYYSYSAAPGRSRARGTIRDGDGEPAAASDDRRGFELHVSAHG
jgi:hypothetical protein